MTAPIAVDGGKYAFRLATDGYSVEILRNGQSWVVISEGCNAVRALMHEVATLRGRLNEPQDRETAIAEIDAMSQEQMEAELRKHGVDPAAPVAVQLDQVRAQHAARGWL